MKREYLFFGPHMARLRRALRHGTRTEDLYPSRDADSIAHMGENDAQYVHDFFFRAKLARARLLTTSRWRVARATSIHRACDVDHALAARD